MSIGAVDLRNAIAAALGSEPPATVAFDYPTVQALSAIDKHKWELQSNCTLLSRQCNRSWTASYLSIDLITLGIHALDLRHLKGKRHLHFSFAEAVQPCPCQLCQ